MTSAVAGWKKVEFPIAKKAAHVTRSLGKMHRRIVTGDIAESLPEQEAVSEFTTAAILEL